MLFPPLRPIFTILVLILGFISLIRATFAHFGEPENGRSSIALVLPSIEKEPHYTSSLVEPSKHGVVTADLFGRLGNQLFQISTALSLAWENNATAIFPDLLTKKNDNISSNYRKIFWRLKASLTDAHFENSYQEPHFQYTPIPYQPNLRLRGYFQSEKYFKKHKDRLIKIFSPSSAIKAYLNANYSHIIDHPNTVSIHFRNYYKENPSHTAIYLQHEKTYFQNAVNRFSKECLFVVFSDDIAWCKEHLSDLAKHMIFIENEPYYHDFYLMSMCKHHIITNSSFSWWAAYLNSSPEKVVVAPKNWFTGAYGLNTQDLIPEEWQKL